MQHSFIHFFSQAISTEINCNVKQGLQKRKKTNTVRILFAQAFIFYQLQAPCLLISTHYIVNPFPQVADPGVDAIFPG